MVSRPLASSIAANDCSREIALALRALAWTVGEPERAERLLALTGLSPADLRGRADEPSVLAAVVGFLAAREADLIACADALGVAPGVLAAAGERLAR